VLPPVFRCGVVPHLALRARKGDDLSDRCHG
jgi:hypothetical protein